MIYFRHCLLKILDEDVKALRISHAFATRVSKSIIPDYDIVKDPICIEDIHTAVMNDEYKDESDFLSDFVKMYKNSVAYNGKNDELSMDALTIFNVVKASIKKYQSGSRSKSPSLSGRHSGDLAEIQEAGFTDPESETQLTEEAVVMDSQDDPEVEDGSAVPLKTEEKKIGNKTMREASCVV